MSKLTDEMLARIYATAYGSAQHYKEISGNRAVVEAILSYERAEHEKLKSMSVEEIAESKGWVCDAAKAEAAKPVEQPAALVKEPDVLAWAIEAAREAFPTTFGGRQQYGMLLCQRTPDARDTEIATTFARHAAPVLAAKDAEIERLKGDINCLHLNYKERLTERDEARASLKNASETITVLATERDEARRARDLSARETGVALKERDEARQELAALRSKLPVYTPIERPTEDGVYWRKLRGGEWCADCFNTGYVVIPSSDRDAPGQWYGPAIATPDEVAAVGESPLVAELAKANARAESYKDTTLVQHDQLSAVRSQLAELEAAVEWSGGLTYFRMYPLPPDHDEWWLAEYRIPDASWYWQQHRAPTAAAALIAAYRASRGSEVAS